VARACRIDTVREPLLDGSLELAVRRPWERARVGFDLDGRRAIVGL